MPPFHLPQIFFFLIIFFIFFFIFYFFFKVGAGGKSGARADENHEC